MSAPTCPYCGAEAKRATGGALYPHRRDLHDKRFWRCVPCQAWVGCHPNSDRPLGRLANATLRKAKMAAHAAFDPRWKQADDKRRARRAAYAWLSDQLNVPKEECHIGMFDEGMCARVVDVCTTPPIQDRNHDHA